MSGAWLLGLTALVAVLGATRAIPTPERLCARLTCPPHHLCMVDKNHVARCECPTMCPAIYSPVCGSDGITYASECQLGTQACEAKVKVDIESLGPCPDDADDEDLPDVLDLDFYGLEEKEVDTFEESVIDLDLEFGISMEDEEDFEVDEGDEDDDEDSDDDDDDDSDDDDDDDSDDDQVGPGSNKNNPKKGRRWNKKMKKAQRGQEGQKGRQRGQWKKQKRLQKQEARGTSRNADGGPRGKGRRHHKGPHHGAGPHSKHGKRMAWKLKRKMMHMRKMNMTSEERSEFICNRLEKDTPHRMNQLLETLSEEERQAWTATMTQRRAELSQCCHQSEISVPECLDAIRNSHWERVCQGAEPLPPWRSARHTGDPEDVMESCCGNDLNDTATCFQNALTGRRHFFKQTAGFRRPFNHTERMDRICERVTSNRTANRVPRGRLANRLSNETREQLALWEERREQVRECCELSEGRLDCFDDLRADRYDLMCEGSEETPRGDVGQGRRGRRHHWMTTKCCQGEEDERYDCFEALRMQRKNSLRNMTDDSPPVTRLQAAKARAACSLAPEVGPCRGALNRFYYDQSLGQCFQFVYGGCAGNGNNFHAKEDCQLVCAGDDDTDDVVVVNDPAGEVMTRKYNTKARAACSLAPEVGPCRGALNRFYYDQSLGQCFQFVYGGCAGNENNFHAEEDCQRVCAGDDDTDDVAVVNDPAAEEVMTRKYNAKARAECALPPEVGPCRAALPRFHYNPTLGRCSRFIFGGCAGNGNNFDTEEECESACAGEYMDEDVAELETWEKLENEDEEEEEKALEKEKQDKKAKESVFEEQNELLEELLADDGIQDEEEEEEEEDNGATRPGPGGPGPRGSCCQAGNLAGGHVSGQAWQQCAAAASAFSQGRQHKPAFCEKKFRRCCAKAVRQSGTPSGRGNPKKLGKRQRAGRRGSQNGE